MIWFEFDNRLDVDLSDKDRYICLVGDSIVFYDVCLHDSGGHWSFIAFVLQEHLMH